MVLDNSTFVAVFLLCFQQTFPPRFQQTSPLLRNGVAQPDDREHRQGGDEEACMAVLNDFYGDGLYFEYLYLYFDIFCVHPTVGSLKARSPITHNRTKKYVSNKNKKDLFFKESNGTMWRATTKSQSSVRMSQDT